MAEILRAVVPVHRCAPVEPGCPMCDEISTAFAAIDIVIDGDQGAPSCPACGRIMLPFSWHDDELPTTYVGRFNHRGDITEVAAWYQGAGKVKAVPAVDETCPARYVWAECFTADTLTRAILAHLVGLDVPPPVWQEITVDIDSVLNRQSTDEWELTVDEIVNWLAGNR